MRDREIIIRIKLPETPRRRWLLGVLLAAIGISAAAYAGLPFPLSANAPAKASDVQSDLNYLMPVTALVSTKGMTNGLVTLPLSSSPTLLSGFQVSVTPPTGGNGNGVFVVSLSGMCAAPANGAISIAIEDTVSSAVSGNVNNNAGNSGNSISALSGYSNCTMTWIETVKDAANKTHTFALYYSDSSSSTTAGSFLGDFTATWHPQP
jgi:hypothetical protein